MVSFKSARKLNSYLVRAKLYPLDRNVGSVECGKTRCEVFQYVTDTKSFNSTVTGESFKIYHNLNCDDKCLIYLMTCKRCKKQYTGQTTDNFWFRWNNYTANARKFERGEPCIQGHLYQHFHSEGHTSFLNDVSVTLKLTKQMGLTLLKESITGERL